MTNELYTERLLLKIVDESATNEVLDYVIRNKDFLAQWEIKRTDEYFTYDFHHKILADEKHKIRSGDMFKVWICTKEAPELIIGSIALNNIVRGAFQSCHLGYRIDQNVRNKGYMTEALKKVIHHAFNKMGLHRIEANIMPRNQASMKLIENLGFYQEGLALKYLKINGVWEDHIHMVMRNTDLEIDED
ncbi:GNAT family N-acetyltransferase [Paenibacillus albiflavus]|uniref:GNAT family N-acetyltransferase n=1 Tax=Paenibacillus albiflavus TaxID=2545760 RepID=A0A4R4EQK9_9BACL|nr:GNAT family N-acetyltransferase [Paenibacillus albiflavus]TCZ80891.1 GNAT family N-acetyltransferase [Paenibacillus albiflavus]